MGGIPYYWSLLKKGKSLPQNIDDIFFKEGAFLSNEYELGADKSYYVLTADIVINDVTNYENWETEAPQYGWEPIGAFKGNLTETDTVLQDCIVLLAERMPR